MRAMIQRFILSSVVLCLVFPSVAQAQADSAKTFKTNCVLCHSANGSGDSAAGKALKAKDLRSAEVQKQTDVALAEVICKGKGKMPAFAAKIQPDDVKKLVAYLRDLAKTK